MDKQNIKPLIAIIYIWFLLLFIQIVLIISGCASDGNDDVDNGSNNGDNGGDDQNGYSWTKMESGVHKVLCSVWGSSGSDVFAVGADGEILHYDGAIWSHMEEIKDEVLTDICGNSVSDVFAVGRQGTILHYDGNVWTDVGSEYDFKNIDIHGVWCDSKTDVFAVGEQEYEYQEVRDVVLHYHGTIWTKMITNGSGTCVWGASRKDVFAAGTPSILHYDGSKWNSMGSWNYSFHFLWGFSGSDVYTTATDWDETGSKHGVILHYDGDSWKEMKRYIQFGDLWGSSSSDLFVLANDLEYQYIYYYNGSNWSNWSFGTDYLFNGVWGASEKDVFVVGLLNSETTEPFFQGVILHYGPNK